MRNYTFVDYATQVYAGVVVGLLLLFHNGTVPAWPWVLAANLAAMVLAHGTIQLHARLLARRKKNGFVDFLRHFYPVLLYTWFFCETGWLNRMFFRDYLDPVVIGWDEALFGCQPSVLFMERMPWLPLSELFYAAYFSYYLMIAGVGLALFLRDRRQFFHYVSVVSFLFYLCYTIYIFVPVIGPRVFFREIADYSLPDAVQQLATSDYYPEAVKSGIFFRIMAVIYHVFEAPGAAMPSSHVAVALCTVSFSFRYLPRIRYFHLGLAILLCLSTIYCRYHYAVDVVAGALTAAMVIPIGHWLYLRFRKPELEGGPALAQPAAAISGGHN
jgi:membrane-associated phospholipid phosphatase